MQIFYENLNGNAIVLNVKPAENVKPQIHKIEGIPPTQQRLRYTLSTSMYYNIFNKLFIYIFGL